MGGRITALAVSSRHAECASNSQCAYLTNDGNAIEWKIECLGKSTRNHLMLQVNQALYPQRALSKGELEFALLLSPV